MAAKTTKKIKDYIFQLTCMIIHRTNADLKKNVRLFFKRYIFKFMYMYNLIYVRAFASNGPDGTFSFVAPE